MLPRISSLAIVTTLGFCTMAQANVYVGAGFNMPNGPSSWTSDIVVADNFAIADITFTLVGLTHQWSGDLRATVTHLDSGNSATLFWSIGVPLSSFGFSSDFNGTYAFNDAFTGSLWTAAQNNTVIPGGNYFATGPGSASQTSLLAAFGNVSIQGTWRLTIVDTFPSADSGSLGGWEISAVPAPGALALLGMAGVTGARRRRR